MKNLRKPFPESARVAFTNSTGATLAAGSVVDLGWAFGVVVNDVTNGAEGLAETQGKFRLPKVDATAMARGDGVGWDGAEDEVVTAASGRPLGVVAEAAASDDTHVMVLLNVDPECYRGVVVGNAASAGLEVDLGFGAIPAGPVVVQSFSISGQVRTARTLTSLTYGTGGDAGKVTIITSAGAASDVHHIIAYRH